MKGAFQLLVALANFILPIIGFFVLIYYIFKLTFIILKYTAKLLYVICKCFYGAANKLHYELTASKEIKRLNALVVSTNRYSHIDKVISKKKGRFKNKIAYQKYLLI